MSPDRSSPTPTPGRARRFSLPVLVALTVLALALGSLGTATASGLTARAVKKIATKVVNHRARTLSVAHAKTADSATTAATLQGLTAADLGTRAYVYSLPVEASNTVRSYAFPGLPAGTYLASYSLTATMSAPGGVLACGLIAAPASPLTVTSFGTPATLSTTYLSRPAASGVLTTTSQTTLSCSPASGAPFALASGIVNTVSFVPIRTTTVGTPTSQ